MNLDGSTYPGMNADIRPVPLHKPFMFLATQEHADNETHARVHISSENNTYYVVLTDSDHMSFTDALLLLAQLGSPTRLSSEKGGSMSTWTRSLVEEFFAKYLKAATAQDLDLTVRLEKK